MIAVCCKLPDEIAICIEWLIRDGCMERYRVGTESYLRWTKWDEHQERLKSRDKAMYPSPDGTFEASTNPRAIAKQSPPGVPHGAPHGIPDGSPHGALKERKGKERKLGERKRKEKKEYPPEFHDMVTSYFNGTLSEREQEAQLEALDGLIRLDGFDQDKIFAVLQAVKQGDLDDANFEWSAQIKSFCGLREFKKGRHANKMHNLMGAYDRLQEITQSQKPRRAFGGES